MQRKTVQRRIIRDVFNDCARPICSEEAFRRARSYSPRIGIATVYRAIKELMLEGWLVAVNLPGEPVRFERAGKDHHHHFQCRECSDVFEINGCPNDIVKCVPPGFVLENHEIVFYGICRECNESSRAHS